MTTACLKIYVWFAPNLSVSEFRIQSPNFTPNRTPHNKKTLEQRRKIEEALAADDKLEYYRDPEDEEALWIFKRA
jgi:hypothetical protein